MQLTLAVCSFVLQPSLPSIPAAWIDLEINYTTNAIPAELNCYTNKLVQEGLSQPSALLQAEELAILTCFSCVFA